jgi:hypothetical protein
VRRLHPAILILLLLVVFALGFFLATTGVLLVTRPRAKKIWDTANVVQQVQTLSQLVTVKYVMEKVVVLEDPSYLGTSRVIMVAHGVLKAGVDFAPLKPADVQISGNKISLVLPPARLTDAYLDEKQTQVIERTTGLLRSFDKNLEQSARQQALDDLQRAARRNGILADADERARTQLANLFHQLGFEKVEFRDTRPGLHLGE